MLHLSGSCHSLVCMFLWQYKQLLSVRNCACAAGVSTCTGRSCYVSSTCHGVQLWHAHACGDDFNVSKAPPDSRFLLLERPMADQLHWAGLMLQRVHSHTVVHPLPDHCLQHSTQPKGPNTASPHEPERLDMAGHCSNSNSRAGWHQLSKQPFETLSLLL